MSYSTVSNSFFGESMPHNDKMPNQELDASETTNSSENMQYFMPVNVSDLAAFDNSLDLQRRRQTLSSSGSMDDADPYNNFMHTRSISADSTDDTSNDHLHAVLVEQAMLFGSSGGSSFAKYKEPNSDKTMGSADPDFMDLNGSVSVPCYEKKLSLSFKPQVVKDDNAKQDRQKKNIRERVRRAGMTEKFKELRTLIDANKFSAKSVEKKTSKSGRISKVALLEETINLINNMEAEAVRLAAQNRVLERELRGLASKKKRKKTKVLASTPIP